MDILSPQKHFNPMLKVKMEWYNDIRGRRGLMGRRGRLGRGRRGLMGRRGRRVVKIEGNSFLLKYQLAFIETGKRVINFLIL